MQRDNQIMVATAILFERLWLSRSLRKQRSWQIISWQGPLVNEWAPIFRFLTVSLDIQETKLVMLSRLVLALIVVAEQKFIKSCRDIEKHTLHPKLDLPIILTIDHLQPKKHQQGVKKENYDVDSPEKKCPKTHI